MFGCCVDSKGKSGGLALLWQKSVEVQLQSFSSSHIDVSVRVEESGEWWRFSGVYGEPDTSKRSEFWKLMRRLHKQSVRPWLCAWDYNEILEHSEKEGGSMRPEWQIRNFRECLTSCELHDLGFRGPAFTWSNHQQDPFTVRERLDRACANLAWSRAFPEARVSHGSSLFSDHLPVLIELCPTPCWDPSGGRKRFRFEAAWLQEPICESIVTQAWTFSSHNKLEEKIAAVSARLGTWGRMFGRETRDIILKLEKSLTADLYSVLTEENKCKRARDKAELTKLILQEEVFWKQRSKDLWLKEGDRNSSFFHAKASRRHQINSIRRLRKDNGEWTVSTVEVQQCILRYFHQVFSSNRPSSDDIRRGTEHLPVVVDPGMAEDLQRPFTEIEVTKALFSMSPLKSPGPDCMPPLFYQKFWHVVKPDVVSCVLAFLNHRILPVGFNATNILLIPKCKQPQSLNQYRPISLCNVVYKIASKSIANRLKPWLDHIIFPSQSAFVPGRLITDNVLLAFETNHFLHTHSKGGKHYMNLKLDISKAYDKVEWPFLRNVLGKLGFPCAFIDLIMLCVSSVSYSFVLSGIQFGSISPQRGLRQGDPLSPYLFLLCTESLSSLFRVAADQGTVPRVAVCRGAPPISHLLFADDTMVFCPARLPTVLNVRHILDIYKLASGQEINLHKSSAVFSHNTPMELQQGLAAELGIRLENRHEVYLGLPTMAFRSKRALFAALKDRIWKRIQGWHEKTLSQAGKATLIQAVIQAIPSYAMSCFRLPKTLLQEFQALAADFFWHDGDRRRIHWLAWTRLCSSKLEGGLGFRDLEAFNLALLSKQLWRLLTRPDSLVSKVLKAKYYPRSHLFDASVGTRPSYTWRSLLAAKDLLIAGCRWRIGTGRSVLVWKDPWLPRIPSFRTLTPMPAGGSNMHVSDLIREDIREWDSELINTIFWPEDCVMILQTPLSCVGRQDLLVWHYSRNGLFSVRSAYHLALSLANHAGPSQDSWNRGLWRSVWQANIPNKTKVFLWRAIRNILPSAGNLQKRRMLESSVCPMCEVETETPIHSFLHCTFARQVWALSCLRWQDIASTELSFESWLLIFHAMGIGVVARDSEGKCLAWLSLTLDRKGSAEMAEAYAAREAICLAIRHQWTRVILEGDCSSLLSKISSEQQDFSDVSPLVYDIRHLACCFESIFCSFTLRSGNAAADLLAKLAMNLEGNSLLLPPGLDTVLRGDLAN
ncbi:UNVERIFIED_CONTAM: putative mitochondrial protein [Sesamum radiatum]|uniref:Mitochondrial protein n=1 Tax=Sesamum radiatum TaxID=300843 RepID=A0AAW2R3E0_SESRA